METNGPVRLSLEAAAGGGGESFEADVVLVSTGRRPFTQNLGLQEMGVKTDRMGRIEVCVIGIGTVYDPLLL